MKLIKIKRKVTSSTRVLGGILGCKIDGANRTLCDIPGLFLPL